MKISCISDTHGIEFDFLQPCDILTVSGDISPCYHTGLSQKDYFFQEFLPKITKNAKTVIFIAGNHDKFLETIMKYGDEEAFKRDLPKNVYYLRDSSVIINGIHFYGTPWTPEFCRWHFMKLDNDEGLGKEFEKIPENVDYLLSHGPAFRFNDKIELPVYMSQLDSHNLGSKQLLKHVIRARPKNLCVGHIHSGSHKDMKILWDKQDLTKYTISRNVSILDESYEPFYKDVMTKEC
jgi:predicted phosphohydrolase